MAGAVEGDNFIGRKAQELRGLLKIRYPIEHGIVTDWEDMERIWQYIYTDELKTLSEEVHPRAHTVCRIMGLWFISFVASCAINRSTSESSC